MSKFLVSLFVYLALTGSVVAALTEIEEDFMQDIEDIQKSMTSNISLQDAATAKSEAVELEAMFKDVEEFYVKKGDAADAVDWSKESRTYLVAISKALEAKNFDAASQSAVSLAKTCKACHKIYKSKD
ncbi:hypothetical protein LG201_00100 [Methylobacillus gramineus]|uniref:hypothetical protein n=1 Tax=Methylobacillus gramineus TaxID=755169 RepID=UPI001CFFB1CA|nr:hypothetical protein [Methylobacillus gramineus]MCB5183606.1 hypothetical protein [Methylobacillus gramineus]